MVLPAFKRIAPLHPGKVSTVNLVPLIAALIMAAVHFFSGRLRFLSGAPRSRWLSVAGGISVAYVIVHLLPELAEYQEAVGEAASLLHSMERHVYLLALLGLVTFYGVEHASRVQRRRHAATSGSNDESQRVTSAVLFSFTTYALYNATIGYLLVHREGGVGLFAVALGVHFLVTDYGLRENHRELYHGYGRWIVSAAVVAGTLVGYVTALPDAAVGILIAFIGGGTILNVLKEELPEERESRFGAFLAGVVVYSAVLLAL